MTPRQARAMVSSRPFHHEPETAVMVERQAGRKMRKHAQEEGQAPLHKEPHWSVGGNTPETKWYYQKIDAVIKRGMTSTEIRNAIESKFGAGTAPKNISQALRNMERAGRVVRSMKNKQVATWGPAQ